MISKEEKLFAEFPEISTSEWEEMIHCDLKGADYNKKLMWKTDEHFVVKPYYRMEDLKELEYFSNASVNEYPFVRGNNENGNDWKIIQTVSEPDLHKANKTAVDAVLRGANALILNAKNLTSVSDMKTLLNGIDLDTVSVSFDNASSYPELATCFLQYVEENKYDKSSIKGAFNFDPINYLLLHNKFWKSQQDDFSEILQLEKIIGKQLPNYRYLTVNGNILHNSGAFIVQELGYALGMAVEYLSFAIEHGVSIDEIAPKINFTFSISSNYFMEIAKLRVARLLWATIIEQYHPKTQDVAKMHIVSISSSWNKTIYDASVNMLRATTEGMSAALGGADAISLSPYDEAYQESNDFSRRITRNIQILLKEESYFDKTADPAAGSYYVENLTNSIAEEAWKLFQETEKQGGLVALTLKGYLKKAIEESCQKRNMDIATRKFVLLGTNQYPNLTENMIDNVKIKENIRYEGLQPFRGSIPFEQLRLSTEKWAKKHGNIKVFLFKIGNLAMCQTRAGFITNFFGCVGYQIIENQGYKTVQEGVKDAVDSKADIVAICSSDEEYAVYVPEIAKTVKKQNKNMQCIVAGNPIDIMDTLKAAGVDDFIHVKVNLLETLRKYNQQFGI